MNEYGRMNICIYNIFIKLARFVFKLYLYGFGKKTDVILWGWHGLFLRYPSDADKHLLARQTGLSRNQVHCLKISYKL